MTQPQVIIATAFSKNRKLSVGVNSYTRSHPLQAKYAQSVGQPSKVFLHAEVSAIIKAMKFRQKIELLQVERYGKNDKMLLAKPCSICFLAIQEAGIQKIRYTTVDGWVEEIV